MSDFLFCPKPKRNSVSCHRGAKKPEHVHIQEAGIRILTCFFLKKTLKPINR